MQVIETSYQFKSDASGNLCIEKRTCEIVRNKVKNEKIDTFFSIPSKFVKQKIMRSSDVKANFAAIKADYGAGRVMYFVASDKLVGPRAAPLTIAKLLGKNTKERKLILKDFSK